MTPNPGLHNSSWRNDPSTPLLALLLIGALGAYGMFDAAFVGVVSGQRLMYAVVALACVIAIVAGVWQLRLTRREAIFCLALMLCTALWLLPVATADRIIAVYVVGDIASVIAPAGLLLAGAIYPEIFRSTTAMVVIGVLLSIALVISIALAGASADGRFESPHDLLLALLWLSLFRIKGIARLLPLGLLLVAFVVTLRSGERASTILWIYGAMYVAALVWNGRRLLLAAIPAVIVVAFVAGTAIQGMAVSALEQSRFSENLDGQVDDSLLSRVSEAQDAIQAMIDRGRPLNYLLGFGHGATFVPVFSSLRNAVADGVVHNIHIGPVLIIYRYGLLGLLIYLFLLYRLAHSFFSHRRRIAEGSISTNELFFTFATTMYLLDGLVFNVIVDPGFSFAVAGYLHYACRPVTGVPLRIVTA
ncbi:MAG: hypothetical protein ACR2QQ_06120 [Gammaproteobacteria bacterium]